MRKLLTFVGLAVLVAVGVLAATASAASPTTVASGSFTLLGPDFGWPNGSNRTVSFSARQSADGTVTGEIFGRSFTGGMSHGIVNCMVVEGNQAIIGGVYTQAGKPTQDGFAFAIQDNPDIETWVFYGFGVTPCQEFLPGLEEPDIGSALTDYGIPPPTGNITIQQLG